MSAVTLLVARLVLATVLASEPSERLDAQAIMTCQADAASWRASWSEMREACHEAAEQVTREGAK